MHKFEMIITHNPRQCTPSLKDDLAEVVLTNAYRGLRKAWTTRESSFSMASRQLPHWPAYDLIRPATMAFNMRYAGIDDSRGKK